MAGSQPIRVLTTHVVNKIAAGEVVDRPASVVKELMENALDAGATQIDVEIGAGGRKLVAVGDNGCGMGRDDAVLSIERHATSKIRDVDDIERIGTLGFRGEALAAIASVSRFRLLTCAAGADAGTEIVIAGGAIQDVRETGCPAGTRIEVRDLFFNVPARRKFLRSYPTELGHVRACFLTLALARPDVGLSLTVDGSPTYRLPAGGALNDRIRELFGQEFARGLQPVSLSGGEIGVSGMVSSPHLHRADRAEQYFFINGRATSAPILNHAVREAYRPILSEDRHPCVFLHISMAPDLVDVNVHPTKREVRFRHPATVREAVMTAIRDAVALPSMKIEPGRGADGGVPPAGGADVPRASIQMPIENLMPTHTFRYPRMGEAGSASAATAATAATAAAAPGVSAGAGGEAPGDIPAVAPPQAPWSWCRVLGQIASLYVVMETEDGMVLMDPKAAHERVLFERLMRQVEAGDVPIQNMLIPETVEMTPKDAARLRRCLRILRAMGFGVSDFGGNSFVVDAVPACLSGAAAREVLHEVPHALEEAGRSGGARWQEELIARTACRAAVNARRSLTLEEIERLVVDLAGTQMPYTSPRGRPTLIFTSLTELNRKFGRA